MDSKSDYYLNISRATDLKDKKERIIFRLLEIMPGVFSWGILILAVFLSWKEPVWVAIFIIVYTIYWLFRTVYFSFHLWASYKKMKKNEKVNWLRRLDDLALKNKKGEPKWHDIYHLIVAPMYNEPLEIVRDNFLSLEKSDYPKDKMIVVLACEERAKKEAEKTAEKIEQEFSNKFFKFMVIWHPADIPGEIAGKGSNETWATKQVKKRIIDQLGISYENVIFSSFDIDTCVFPKYFSCLTYYYLTSEKPERTSFQPIPIYVNNIWQAPTISKIFSFSSTFWHTINQGRQEKLVTFSSHSMSFQALVDLGFKQTNVVSDDSRIFWQAFLKYNGNYEVQPLYYPISMDANAAKNIWRTMANIYRQQKRWAYGAENIPYFIFGFIKNKKIPFKKKLFLGLFSIEEYISWATSSILMFLLGWLPLILGGAVFSQTLISYNLPVVISKIMTISMLGLLLSIYLSFIFLPPMPPNYGRFEYLVFGFGWVLFPFMMIFFTSFPALDAQTRLMLGKYMGFWVTEKVRK